MHVVTDVLDLDINLQGGEHRRAPICPQYPLHKDTPNVPVRLENRDPHTRCICCRPGSPARAGEAAPTHLATYLDADAPTLAAGADGAARAR